MQPYERTFTTFLLHQFVPTEDFLTLLVKCIQDVSRHLSSALAPPSNPHVLMMRSLLEMVMQLRLAQSHLNIIGLLQKVSYFNASYSSVHACCS